MAAEVDLSLNAYIPVPLLEIPVELRAKIFEKLDSKSLLQLRLSCWDLKAVIDYYIGIDASLSEICTTQINLEKQFEFFSRVALRNITVGVMNGTPQSSPSKRTLTWSWWLKHHTFQDLFRYPEYLQSVTCNCEINFWLLQEIMMKCFNLKSLEFNPVSKIHGILSFIQPSQSNDISCPQGKKPTKVLYYKKLQRLLLSSVDVNEKRQACLNSITMLKTVRSSVLRQFKFECWPAESMEVFNGLLITLKEFITFHETLKEVHLIFRLTTLMQDISSFDGYRQNFQSYLTEIAECSQVEVFGLDVYSKSDWVWKPLFKRQRNLKTVQFTTLLSTADWNFDEIFLNSSATLTILSLQIYVPLRSSSVAPIDLSGLEKCANLKEVNILNKSTSLRCVHNFHPFVTHLDALPDGLETLSISYVIMETEEIVKLMKKLSNLKNLLLISSVLTRFSSYGVNIHCLEEILNKPSLEAALITGLNTAYKCIFKISEALGENCQIEQDEGGVTTYADNPGTVSEDGNAIIAFDLEILSAESCPFTWAKKPLDNRPLGHFYELHRKIPYMGWDMHNNM